MYLRYWFGLFYLHIISKFLKPRHFFLFFFFFSFCFRVLLQSSSIKKKKKKEKQKQKFFFSASEKKKKKKIKRKREKKKKGLQEYMRRVIASPNFREERWREKWMGKVQSPTFWTGMETAGAGGEMFLIILNHESPHLFQQFPTVQLIFWFEWFFEHPFLIGLYSIPQQGVYEGNKHWTFVFYLNNTYKLLSHYFWLS